MSAFGEQIARDMQEVCLNGDEFAETHDLNGTKCRCVVHKKSRTIISTASLVV